MNPVYILIVLPAIPLLVWGCNRKYYSKRLNNVSVSAISAVVLYIFILVSVAYIEHKLDAELAAFDLNGDGVFTGNEITPDQEKAMYRVIADTGRTFAPFTGAIFSLVYFAGVWLLFALISWFSNRRAGNNP